MEKLYYTAKEVAEMLDVSVSHAYKVIREANDGIVSLDNDFQYPQGALQFVTNLNMECVNYKIQEMNCQSDCQKYLSRWPILRVKHIRYQVIMFERMS